jgi:hypothetical protein
MRNTNSSSSFFLFLIRSILRKLIAALALKHSQTQSSGVLIGRCIPKFGIVTGSQEGGSSPQNELVGEEKARLFLSITCHKQKLHQLS